ncbi:MAG: helix-turn-helix transcriptional regulator [Nanoarchaeota archaeon]|nr:helix-turn-helix transcriptional regulator [Nanoarchaeota archaeon]
MSKEKFLLVSLKDNKTKKLAQIVSNDTARMILDYLAENEATESELSQQLRIPISTVHYNLQQLVNGKLVEAEEFHYSEKGKEVMHYKLANKYIIIAPKSTFGIKEKLKGIFSILSIAVFGSATIYIMEAFHKFSSGAFMIARDGMMREAAEEAVLDSAVKAPAAMAESAAAFETDFINFAFGQNFFQNFLNGPASWFLFGSMFILLLVIVIEYINYKRKK